MVLGAYAGVNEFDLVHDSFQSAVRENRREVRGLCVAVEDQLINECVSVKNIWL